MRNVLILSGFVLVAMCAFADALSAREVLLQEWRSFKANHTKNYADRQEDEKRLRFFERARTFIAEHNRRFARGKETFELGLNEFADLTPEEIALHNGYNQTLAEADTDGTDYVAPRSTQVPDTLDWRTQGAVTPVKNQGRCGSCYAFASTGALEGQTFLKTGKLISLSEQNLVDCSSRYGNSGCNGGWMGNAFKYVKNNNGIDTEDAYPYRGVVGQCRFNRASVGATDSGYTMPQKGNENKLKEAVAAKGPIAVAIDASQRAFTYYRGGVYSDRNCNSNQVNHAVLIVGYGSDPSGGDYWLVKNSWGEKWGEKGYVKIARNRNMCGIANLPIYPTV